MMKVRRHITPILTLALLEFCFFVFGNYPKNLFDVRLMNIVYNYLPAFFTKLLWVLLFVSVVLLICKWIFFSERYAFTSEYFKDIIICSVKILLIRLILDGVMLLTPPLLYVDAVHFILDLFFTAMLFLIIYKRLAIGKKIKINKKVILSTVILIAVSATYAVLSIYKTKQGMDLINYLNEKYIYISIPDVTKNLSFELSLYRLLFNIISVILIYIIFLNAFANKAKSDTIRKTLVVVRCFSLVIVLVFLYVAKLLISPHNTISRINVNTSDSHERQFYTDEYMIKYDGDYIKPFLVEYSSGIYDESINQNINKEYIIKFSQDVLNNNFLE